MLPELDSNNLLAAYASGYFPMADDDGTIIWVCPERRAIFEIEGYRPARSVRQLIRRGVFEVRLNHDFPAIIEACADRPEGTWISGEVLEAYTELHERGVAHSVECWQEGTLVGGLYGVALGGAFFGESMFHRATNASKVAFAHLVAHLGARGFVLLDAQFMTDHLRRLGAIEISKAEYERRLLAAARLVRSFTDDTQSVYLRFDDEPVGDKSVSDGRSDQEQSGNG
jgi:leucyl/phenylalanyl-tRNA--protein transferase